MHKLIIQIYYHIRCRKEENIIFESENDETAMRDADKFAWYFDQEYAGEDNIDWHYPSKPKEKVLYGEILNDAIRCDDYSELDKMVESGEVE